MSVGPSARLRSLEMAEHTPPPWHCQKRDDGDVEILDENDAVLATVYGDDNDPQCWPVTENAEVIASAPRLKQLIESLTVQVERLQKEVKILERQSQIKTAMVKELKHRRLLERSLRAHKVHIPEKVYTAIMHAEIPDVGEETGT
jgi:hypothetical protein